ncbi:MAG TPA: hypothetical protein VKU44_11610, partial [Terriglobia bacterium]|nr:hypothetical protein [Terriglobia bacterium]
MSSDDGKLELALVFGLGVGIVTFFKGFRTYREYRVIEDTPEIPIRSIPMGLVRVHGRAQGEQTVASPVTRTPCYFYRVDIERWKSDQHGGSWSHYRTDLEGVKFYLEDGSGHVLVDAHGAECDLEQACRREVHGGSTSNPAAGPAAGMAAGAGGAGASAGATDAELLSYVSRVSTTKVLGFVGRRLEAAGPVGDPNKEQMRHALAEAFTHPLEGQGFSELMALQAPMLRQRLEARGPLPDPEQERVRLATLDALRHPVGSPEFKAALSGVQGSAAGVHIESFVATMRGLQQHGIAGIDFSSGASGRYRFTEYCIVPGRDYDITGTCMENAGAQDEHDRNL